VSGISPLGSRSGCARNIQQPQLIPTALVASEIKVSADVLDPVRLLLLTEMLSPVLDAACDVKVDTVSAMFGATWQSSWSLYTQEPASALGHISKVNLYYNQHAGCVVGIKPTYGQDSYNARRIGVEQLDGVPVSSAHLQLTQGEFIVKAFYRDGRLVRPTTGVRNAVVHLAPHRLLNFMLHDKSNQQYFKFSIITQCTMCFLS
jgi:hypothetical protein